MNAILAVALGGLVFLPTPSGAHSGHQLAEFGTATVDGVISAGEYGDSCLGPLSQTTGDWTYTFTICETNDEENDYYAVQIDDQTGPSTGDEDNVTFLFDNDHDGKVAPAADGDCAPPGEPVEDLIGYSYGFFVDFRYCFGPPGFFGGDQLSQDGTASQAFTAGVGWVYELSHPLDSGDPDDYSLSLEDTVGWCFAYDDGSGSGYPAPEKTFPGGEVQFPQGCVSDWASKGSAANYADVVKLSHLDEILEGLQSLVDSCEPCPPKVRDSLLAKVNEALRQFQRGHQRAAVQALQNFIMRAERFIRSGDLPELEGQRLIAEAEAIIEQIEAPAPKLATRPTGAR